MGLTKQYLKYKPSGKFNIIASTVCNSVWVTLKSQEGRFIACGACEDVVVWDGSLLEKALVFPGEKSIVTCLTKHSGQEVLAAGFKDGSVKTYDLSAGEVACIFSGHRQSITCLSYDKNGHRLASGSGDNHIVVWDVISEVGLSRLLGHKGPITSLCFMNNHNLLISSSKDASIKFWDLDTNYCFKTLMVHRTEVWGIALMRNEEFLVTGSGDSELRIWRITSKETERKKESNDNGIKYEEYDLDFLSPIQLEKCGSIIRMETGRVTQLCSDPTGQILAVRGITGTLELFHFTSHLESMVRYKKRAKKEMRAKKENVKDFSTAPTLRDIVRRLPAIKLKVKIKSVDIIMGENGELRVVPYRHLRPGIAFLIFHYIFKVTLMLNNNSVEIYAMETIQKKVVPVCKRKIANHGHRTEARATCFSSDNLAVVTGSCDSIKVWNRSSLACIRTINTGYILCLGLVPGDRHILAGLKDGKLLIVDLNVGDILEEIRAHDKDIWSVCITPDQRGCITGSSDSTVKFWDFMLIDDKDSSISAKVLSLVHVKTLTLDDSVIGVSVTPNSKLLAVSLLDMTVKLFFLDSLKYFICLYGHKLPILSMDISSDSSLIVTGSADRNIKIWGLDFGDCHKSIFAHDDSVTSVRFIPGTHYFFSCGKDGKIKQWDADNFQKIITLEGHFGEAFNLSVSPNGKYLVSSGSDRVLRLVTKSDEPLVLEDEAEEERAKEEETILSTEPETTVKGHSSLKLPTKKTVGSEKGAEEILEALDVIKYYKQLLKEYELDVKTKKKNVMKPSVPSLMVALGTHNPPDFIVEVIGKIRSSDLEEALLLLPLSAVNQIWELFSPLLRCGTKTELITRVLLFLIKIHHGPIVNNHNMLLTIKEMCQLVFNQMKKLRDVIGCNVFGLLYLQKQIESHQGIELFKEAGVLGKRRQRKRKRKEQAQRRAILAMS